MEAADEYRPDPPAGIGYADFQAARARFHARLAEQSEIARLEHMFHTASEAPPERSGAEPRAIRERPDPVFTPPLGIDQGPLGEQVGE